MMMYDIHMHLDSLNTITSDGSEYIMTIFNTNTQKTINIVCVYRAHSCSISTKKKQKLLYFMGNFQLKSQFSGNTT
jgi:Tat protein secretion system quality control protein TatD with DNase activity